MENTIPSAVLERKQCTKCKETRPLTDFYTSRLNKSGYVARCKECQRPYSRRENLSPERLQRKRDSDRNRDKRKKRNENLKRRHGITIEQYEAMYKEQGGVCWICKKPETSIDKSTLKHLVVDHDHDTGKIRGLLCSRCNLDIGHFEKKIKILEEQAKLYSPYLNRTT